MPERMSLETEDIVGYSVTGVTIPTIVRQLTRLIQSNHRPCSYFACLNPHAVEMAARDMEFDAALREADFLTADGIGIVYVSRLSGGRIRDRITGTDIFLSLTRAMNEKGGMSCFFLGSTDEVLQRICKRVMLEFPEVRICGTYSPPFKASFEPEETDEMVRRVNDAAPDVLWVGMTAPKQETWIYQNRHRLDVAFAGPIGAVFDFYAGSVKRAGPIWQSLGLEWLPRLLREPRRLWRRNLISAPAFFIRSARYQFSRPNSMRTK